MFRFLLMLANGAIKQKSFIWLLTFFAFIWKWIEISRRERKGDWLEGHFSVLNDETHWHFSSDDALSRLFDDNWVAMTKRKVRVLQIFTSFSTPSDALKSMWRQVILYWFILVSIYFWWSHQRPGASLMLIKHLTSQAVWGTSCDTVFWNVVTAQGLKFPVEQGGCHVEKHLSKMVNNNRCSSSSFF